MGNELPVGFVTEWRRGDRDRTILGDSYFAVFLVPGESLCIQRLW